MAPRRVVVLLLLLVAAACPIVTPSSPAAAVHAAAWRVQVPVAVAASTAGVELPTTAGALNDVSPHHMIHADAATEDLAIQRTLDFHATDAPIAGAGDNEDLLRDLHVSLLGLFVGFIIGAVLGVFVHDRFCPVCGKGKSSGHGGAFLKNPEAAGRARAGAVKACGGN